MKSAVFLPAPVMSKDILMSVGRKKVCKASAEPWPARSSSCKEAVHKGVARAWYLWGMVAVRPRAAAVHLFVVSLLQPGLALTVLTCWGWPWASDPSVSTSQELGWQITTFVPISVVLRIRLRTSCMLGECSTNWVTSRVQWPHF